MKNQISKTRRNMFKIGLGSLGTLVAAKSLAQVCGLQTGEQPLGPFFPKPGTPEDVILENSNSAMPLYLANDSDLTIIKGRPGKAQGQIVYVNGQVTDENCQPVANATLIIWQASKSGRYNHKGDAENHDFTHPKTGELIKRVLDPSFQCWGKATTDQNGNYQFKTIVPGFYPADLQAGWYRPPHIHFMVSATGFSQFVTQLYFAGEKIIDRDWIQELNEKDYLLQSSSLTDAQRKELIVQFDEDPSGKIKDGLVGTFKIALKR